MKLKKKLQQKVTNQKVCKRCGRLLKTAESIQVGMGSVCYQKYLAEKKSTPHFKFMDK